VSTDLHIARAFILSSSWVKRPVQFLGPTAHKLQITGLQRINLI
jgi:hypothetical protein